MISTNPAAGTWHLHVVNEVRMVLLDLWGEFLAFAVSMTQSCRSFTKADWSAVGEAGARLGKGFVKGRLAVSTLQLLLLANN